MSWTRENSLLRRRTRRLLVAASWLVALGAAPSLARAQAPAGGDAAMAETLFHDARELMELGDYASACPKLAESNRLDAGSGTLTALAVCHEALGKTASAWTEFIQVVSDSRQAGRTDREKFAQQHIHALEPKLSRLMVLVDPATAQLPGLEVRRDGTALGPAGWGTASPIDPGDHTIDVAAPNKKSVSIPITVAADADSETVHVPLLEDAPPAARAAADDAATAPGGDAAGAGAGATRAAEGARPVVGRTQRTTGLVLGAAGVVALGIGSYFGLQAISKSSQANGKCPNPSACTDPDAVSLNGDARSAAQIADYTLGAGLAALVAGAIVYVTAPSSPAAPAAALRVVPVASLHGPSLFVDGTW